MGYTHYWRNSFGFTDEQWETLQESARHIFGSTQAKLGDAHGENEPEVAEDAVAFNGLGDESYESCVILRAGESFSFCKTARRPYDSTVVAVLTCAERINAHFEMSSDGDDSELAEGRALAEAALRAIGFAQSS